MHNPKVILVIMDGWGYSPIKRGNAIYEAKTPVFDQLWSNYSHTLLNSFGENVGLPWGAIGSSEVGHTSIGSGRLVNQELSLIDKEVFNGNFYHNKVVLDLIDKTSKNGNSLHLAGLVSDGNVHSNMSHLFALLKMLKIKKFKFPIFIHAFTDGRDTSPESALQYLNELEKQIKRIGVNAKIATVSGRYFAMDRDNRWDRTKKAYIAMAELSGKHAPNIKEAIRASYDQKVTDEFIEPTIIDFKQDKNFLSKIFRNKTPFKNGKIEDGDGVILFNIRPDRMRQISEMFVFERKDQQTSPLKNLNIVTMTTYNQYLPVQVAYHSEVFDHPLAKILSEHGVTQGHFAETEKYAHVTYFFNGGNPEPFPGESWHLVPSPDVTTYDKEPETSAAKITDQVFKETEDKKMDFILINYANADLVGHTGVFDKVVIAIETIDKQLARLTERFPEITFMVTADHGNAECMIHPETGEVDKRHTVNPVPFILVNKDFKKATNINDIPSATGILADIAPTILHFFDIKPPADMTGISLVDSLK